LIGEVFPIGGLRERADKFHDYIKKTCRIICELGADAIKTFYTGERFAEVTEGIPIPVFALGAEKMEREIDALELAHEATSAGARGVVFGRNVIQARDPAQFLRGLKEAVKGYASPPTFLPLGLNLTLHHFPVVHRQFLGAQPFQRPLFTTLFQVNEQ
jgi:hypothetical protein